jgi:hypothetical protein
MMMNKRTKISLILAITIIFMTLSVGFASAAKPTTVNASSCRMTWMVIDKDGVHKPHPVWGDAVWTMVGNIITKTCTGDIPLGGMKYKLYYYDLDEMRDYLADTYGADVGDPFVIGPEDTGGAQMTNLYKGDVITSSDWTAFVNSNGDFEWVAYFEID